MALLLAAAPVFAAEDIDIGPWRLGMSKEQVVAITDQGPYTDVAATGGLETKDGKFKGKKANTSFVFAGGTLRSIEVRVYEGKAWDKAKDAALDVFDQFVANYGGASVKDVSPKVDRKELEKILDRTLGTAGEMNKQYAARARAMVVTYDMAPLRQPADSRLHCQWIYLGKSDTYSVVVYQDVPGAKSRDAEENIVIEKL
ncbi:MAG: hypothetical protein ABIQ86_14365 [Steroidobacteraceae bacterium]